MSLGLLLPSSVLSLDADPSPTSDSDSSIEFIAEARALADCPTGYLCVWTGSLYSGTMWKSAIASAQNLTANFQSGSVVNNRASASYVYSGSKGSGSVRCIPPGARQTNMLGILSASVSFNPSC